MTGHVPIFDAHQLAQCVECGLCLSSCPTYAVTHLEQHGPRGRIQGMRLAQAGEIDLTDPDSLDSIETCVQCRACEAVCPSDVEFGALMEDARHDLHRRRPPRGLRAAVERAGYGLLAHRGLLRVATVLLMLAQALRLDRLLPPRLRLPVRLRAGDVLAPLRGSGGVAGRPAHLFRGCVMDQWFRPVHAATVRVLAAAGYRVRTDPAPACCGALHLHAGRADQARRLARAVVAAYRDTTGPVVVDSGGCAAMLKEYGRLLATPEAEAFAARVVDVTEAVGPHDLPPLRRLPLTVAYQASCHLRNVARVDAEPRRLLAAVPGLRLVEPADGQLCCGAGGAYSLTHPEFADPLRERKAGALAATGCSVVATGNPGCALQLARAGLAVVHPVELLARALPDPPTGAVD